MMSFAIVLVALSVGVATCWSYWRRLRSLLAVRARSPRHRSLPVSLRAILTSDQDILLAFDGECGVNSLVIEPCVEADEFLQLQEWCSAGALLDLRADPIYQSVALREPLSGRTLRLQARPPA